MSIGDGANPGNNTPVNSPSNPSPEGDNASTLGVRGWAAGILAFAVVVGLVVLSGLWTYQRFTSPPFVPDASAPQTEAKFQSFVFEATDPGQSEFVGRVAGLSFRSQDHRLFDRTLSRHRDND